MARQRQRQRHAERDRERERPREAQDVDSAVCDKPLRSCLKIQAAAAGLLGAGQGEERQAVSQEWGGGGGTVLRPWSWKPAGSRRRIQSGVIPGRVEYSLPSVCGHLG